MIPDIFNYKASFLNPALKLIVAFVFVWGAYYLYQARNQYQGEIGKVVRRLMIAGIIGSLACFFRFGADIWFSSLKWGESLFFLAFGIANAYAAWPLLTFMRRTGPELKDAKIETASKVSASRVK
jgi:hypothetical protein